MEGKKITSRIILLYVNEIDCNYYILFYVENLRRLREGKSNGIGQSRNLLFVKSYYKSL